MIEKLQEMNVDGLVLVACIILLTLLLARLGYLFLAKWVSKDEENEEEDNNIFL